MLTLTRRSTQSSISVGCQLPSTPIVEGDAIWALLSSHDLLFSFDLRRRNHSEPQAITATMKGIRPFIKHNTYVEGWDRFGNYISTIGHMLTDWDFATKQVTSIGDNPVCHYNLRGNLVYTPISDGLYPPNGDAYTGIHIEKDPFGNFVITPWSWTNSIASWGLLDHDLSNVLPHVYLGTSLSYSHFTYLDGIFQYCIRRQWFDGSWYHRYFTLMKIFLYDPSITTDLPSGDYSLEEVLGDASVEHALIQTQNWLPGYEPAEPDLTVPDILTDISWWVNSIPLSSTRFLVGYDAVDPTAVLDQLVCDVEGGRNFKAFCTLSTTLARDSYAGCFLSSTDALDQYFGRLSADHVEFLAELDGLLSPIDILRALQSLYAIRRNPTKALKALLELLADAKLVYSFGIAPTYGDAVDVATNSKALYNKLSSLSLYQEQTINGKFNYEIPFEFTAPFRGVRLTCHSKIRLRLHEDSLLPALIPLRSLNLLPTVSSLWNLVPFSFMIDWFIPVGNVADALETRSLMMLSDVVASTHSITIEYELEDDLLLHYEVLNEMDSRPSAYRYYDRFILSHIPTAAPTRFPIYGGFGVPDWSLLAALVYKFL